MGNTFTTKTNLAPRISINCHEKRDSFAIAKTASETKKFEFKIANLLSSS